jgi:predicted DsbA family dithiol-disulfide isomerase
MIGSHCIMCILTYFVNLFLLWYAWLVCRRFASGRFLRNLQEDWRFVWQRKQIYLTGSAIFITTVMMIVVLMPPYWHLGSESLLGKTSYGITADGRPWFGAQNPEITIEMYSDYQCFQCKKMHAYLQKILSGDQQKIRVIQRHYPMDHEFNYIVKEPFHVGSGKMALLAIYAASRGKFWEMNELLFKISGHRKQIDLNWIAQKTGLKAAELMQALYSPAIRKRLSIDIRQGMKLRVLGTPSFVIKGSVYAGNIPAEVLQPYVK